MFDKHPEVQGPCALILQKNPQDVLAQPKTDLLVSRTYTLISYGPCPEQGYPTGMEG